MEERGAGLITAQPEQGSSRKKILSFLFASQPLLSSSQGVIFVFAWVRWFQGGRRLGFAWHLLEPPLCLSPVFLAGAPILHLQSMPVFT